MGYESLKCNYHRWQSDFSLSLHQHILYLHPKMNQISIFYCLISYLRYIYVKYIKIYQLLSFLFGMVDVSSFYTSVFSFFSFHHSQIEHIASLQSILKIMKKIHTKTMSMFPRVAAAAAIVVVPGNTCSTFS